MSYFKITYFFQVNFKVKKKEKRNLLFQEVSPDHPRFRSGPVFCDSKALCPYRCPGLLLPLDCTSFELAWAHWDRQGLFHIHIPVFNAAQWAPKSWFRKKWKIHTLQNDACYNRNTLKDWISQSLKLEANSRSALGGCFYDLITSFFFGNYSIERLNLVGYNYKIDCFRQSVISPFPTPEW